MLARPGIALITVDPETVRRAQQKIESCQLCHPNDAEIPFDWMLAEVMGKHGPYEFVMNEPARCPSCGQTITEKMLVQPIVV